MPDMIAIPGGTLLMGSDEFYRDEGPVHERNIVPFELDVHPVTNEEYRAFVDETGYVTVAERDLASAMRVLSSAAHRGPAHRYDDDTSAVSVVTGRARPTSAVTGTVPVGSGCASRSVAACSNCDW
jgi:formylglycine-generating enzyme required for sulfatase activity